MRRDETRRSAIAFGEVLRIRETKESRRFREWLSTDEPMDSRDLERLYAESLSALPAVSSMSARLLRFGMTAVWGVVDRNHRLVPLVGVLPLRGCDLGDL